MAKHDDASATKPGRKKLGKPTADTAQSTLLTHYGAVSNNDGAIGALIFSPKEVICTVYERRNGGAKTNSAALGWM